MNIHLKKLLLRISTAAALQENIYFSEILSNNDNKMFSFFIRTSFRLSLKFDRDI